MSQEDNGNRKENERYKYVYIRGLPLLETLLIPELVEEVMDYKPNDQDIFIVTYPKCGTTWMQFLVWEIMHKGALPPSPNQMMFQHIPFLEYTGIESIKNLPRPRVMKTHLPFHLQPFSPSAKYIYVVRNPWDCCVSYYYHLLADLGPPAITFHNYLPQFLKGNVPWGSFFDHVLSWYNHSHYPNILFLTYEDMKKDTRKVLLKTAKFLGDSYYEDLQSEDIVENCLKYSDFQYLKQLGLFFPNLKTLPSDPVEAKKEVKNLGDVDRAKAEELGYEEWEFFRKGVVGDWTTLFSPNQVAMFNDCMIAKLKNTEMENYWPPAMQETAL